MLLKLDGLKYDSMYSEEITRKKILLIIISTDANVCKLLILVSKYSGSMELILLALQFSNPSDSYLVGICEPCMGQSLDIHINKK